MGGIMPAINILQMFPKQFELFLVQESWTAKTYIALSLGSRFNWIWLNMAIKLAIGGLSSLKMSNLKQLQKYLTMIFLNGTQCKIRFRDFPPPFILIYCICKSRSIVSSQKSFPPKCNLLSVKDKPAFIYYSVHLPHSWTKLLIILGSWSLNTSE